MGCKHVSTLKLWMTAICNAAYYYNKKNNYLLFFEKKSFILFIYFYSDGAFSFLEKPVTNEIVEIFDILREEDQTSNFFRKNKMFPNQDVSTSFINKICSSTYNKSSIIRKSVLLKYESILVSAEGGVSPIGAGLMPNFNAEDDKVKFDSFEIIKLLGSGSFGKVFLVKKKVDGILYAMKVLKKRDLIIRKKLRYAITETKILKTCNHPFILQIYYSFQVNFLFMMFYRLIFR